MWHPRGAFEGVLGGLKVTFAHITPYKLFVDVFVPQTRQIVKGDVVEKFLDFKMYISGFGLALKAPKIADLGHFRA